MSEALKEMIWMGGCATLMAAFGVTALVGYLRREAAQSVVEKNSPTSSMQKPEKT